MRTSLSICMTVLLSVVVAGMGYATPAWKTVAVSDYSHGSQLAGFLNPQFGVTVGRMGEVHYTEDGGKTWPMAKNASPCRFGLEIIDSGNIINCGNGPNIMVSHDGGKNWALAGSFGFSEPDHCRYISFINPLTGWIASPSMLALTLDGAKSWQNVKLPAGINGIMAMDGISENEVFIFSQKGYLFSTKDTGKTWNKTAVNLNGSQISEEIPFSAIVSLRFQDENKGTLVLLTDKPERRWLVMRTENGGSLWNNEELPSEVSDARGNVYLTKDGKYLTIQDWFNSKIYVLAK